jgi:hypothetical protein
MRCYYHKSREHVEHFCQPRRARIAVLWPLVAHVQIQFHATRLQLVIQWEKARVVNIDLLNVGMDFYAREPERLTARDLASDFRVILMHSSETYRFKALCAR